MLEFSIYFNEESSREGQSSAPPTITYENVRIKRRKKVMGDIRRRERKKSAGKRITTRKTDCDV